MPGSKPQWPAVAVPSKHVLTGPLCSGIFEGAQAGEGRLVFSDRCGRVRLHNVSVLNKGLDWEHPTNVYSAPGDLSTPAHPRMMPALEVGHHACVPQLPRCWQDPAVAEGFCAAQVHRREATRIILHGQSEFEASDVVLIGNHMFEVSLS